MTEQPPPPSLPPPPFQAHPGTPYAGAPGQAPLYPYGAPFSVPTGLATAALVFAGLLTVVQAGLGAISWSVADELEGVLQGDSLDVAVLNAYDGLSLLLLVVGIVAYVLNCLWLQRVRRNAEAAVPHARHARSRIWVWLGWWVPVVSLWFPYQVVRDVTDARHRSQSAIGLGLWWTGWIVWAGASRASGRMLSTTDPERIPFTTFAVLETLAAIGLVVALARWIVIVRRTNQHQAEWLQPGMNPA